MLFTQNRAGVRRFFCEAWRKHRERLPLEPMEDLIAQIITRHPEYHAILEAPDEAHEKDYTPEMGQTNPFLHLALHVALQEQIMVDRPRGIRDIQQRLAQRLGDKHEAEHRLLECLAEMIWQSQRHGKAPDEKNYLECLRKAK